MKPRIQFLILLLALNLQPPSLLAQGTAFTYQGRLNDGTNPASGMYDLRFGIYDAAIAGSQQGNFLTNSATAVSNGLFTVTLDFGNQFFGAARWLDIAVRTNGAALFIDLSPRQELTPAPYAIFASNAANATVAASVPGTGLSGTYSGPVNFNNPGNGFTGDGSGLNNVNAATLGGLGSGNFWQLGGNNVSSGQLLGCTNDQLLDLYANGVRAMRLVLRTDGLAIFTNAPNVIAGSSVNFVNATNVGGTIGGGGGLDTNGYSYANAVTGDFGTVSGGYQNTAGDVASTVGGGYSNFASGQDATIGGGYVNVASGIDSTVGGGELNNAGDIAATVAGGGVNTASGNSATVAGGYENTASGIGASIAGGGYDGSTVAGNKAQSKAASVGGGLGNNIRGNSPYAVIAGGAFNTNSGTAATVGGGNLNLASGDYTTVAGGADNTASGQFATISGGWQNTASGLQATVAGGIANLASGASSFAAGTEAQAKHDGSFVWADSAGYNYASSFTNGFFARCTGGVRFVTAIDGTGAPSAGVKLTPGDTAWSAISDRNAKKNFQAVDGLAVLNKLAAMPVERWNYKWEADTNTPHIGPMAQDFKGAFYPGRDDKSISTLEFDGVELAAIQGLNQKVEVRSEKAEGEIRLLKAENAELKARLQTLERIVLQQKTN